jgi:hypothetical protein
MKFWAAVVKSKPGTGPGTQLATCWAHTLATLVAGL